MSDLNFVEHVQDHRDWSFETFGPPEFRGVEGVIDHLRKEIEEVADDPKDLEEWIDIITLGIDGAWRSGHEPEDIAECLAMKLKKNKQRTWPDWRTQPKGKAIEHVREM